MNVALGVGALSPLHAAIYKCIPQKVFDLLLKHPKTNPNILAKDFLWVTKKSHFYDITYDIRNKSGYDHIFYTSPLQFVLERSYVYGELEHLSEDVIQQRLLHMWTALIESGAHTDHLIFPKERTDNIIIHKLIGEIMRAYLGKVAEAVSLLHNKLTTAV